VQTAPYKDPLVLKETRVLLALLAHKVLILQFLALLEI
jgi:hypothetical protein